MSGLEASADRAEGCRRGPETWTFDAVQERLVEAFVTLGRTPDRERRWQRIGSSWPKIAPKFGMDAVEVADHLLNMAFEAPDRMRPAAVTRREVDEMEEALGWLSHVDPRDRKLVGLALAQLARGHSQIMWSRMLKPLGLPMGSDGLRMRYTRAVASIARKLSAPAPKL